MALLGRFRRSTGTGTGGGPQRGVASDADITAITATADPTDLTNARDVTPRRWLEALRRILPTPSADNASTVVGINAAGDGFEAREDSEREIHTDDTIDGDGTSGDPYTVANPYPQADEDKLADIEENATADQTADEIVTAIEGQTGNDRLDASTLRNHPQASTSQAGDIEIADNDETDAGTDASKAATPAGVERRLGPRISSAEIAAGTGGSIRRYTPADIVAMILAHEAEGLTETEVDARVRALVNDIAEAGNTGRWPKTKLPADLVDTAALTAAVADFVSGATITSERTAAIAAAIAALNHVSDGGSWDEGTAYAEDTIVRHGGATYLSNIAVSANSASTTEPGVGSDWETYWDRLGYEDGPPNAFVGAALAGRILSFTRESGENPLQVTLPAATDSPYAFHARPTLTPPDDLPFLPTRTDVAVPDDRDYVITLLDQQEITGRVLAGQDFITEWEGAVSIAFHANTVLEIDLRTTHSFNGKSLIHTRRGGRQWMGVDDSFTFDLNRFNSRSVIRTGTYTAQDGTTVEITEADLEGPTTISYELLLRTYGQNLSSRASRSVVYLAFRSAAVTNYQLGATTGEQGVPGPSTFTPTDLGTATFDLSGAAEEVALVDSGNDAIVAPEDGYVLAIINVPSLGIVGSLTWMLAADLRDADRDDTLVAGLYTNGDNEILFHAGAQSSGASTGNEIIIQHIGTTTDDSSGAEDVVLPSIARFDVTGDARPSAGSIAGDTYSFDLAISQSSEVAVARIVGFAGAPIANPSSVAVLHTVPSGSYHSESGTVTIPAGISLAATEQYTIRLEVYPTGAEVSEAPTIYHDYVITAQAPTGLVHFGTVQYNAADTTVQQRANRIVFADDDISTSGDAVGDWLFSGVPNDGNEYIPYWAVPTGLTQPTRWVSSNFDISNFLEDAVQRTIAGVTYNIYMYQADSRADDSVNGTTVTTS